MLSRAHTPRGRLRRWERSLDPISPSQRAPISTARCEIDLSPGTSRCPTSRATGSTKTAESLLTATDNQMGHTMNLTQRDVAALKAYLETL